MLPWCIHRALLTSYFVETSILLALDTLGPSSSSIALEFVAIDVGAGHCQVLSGDKTGTRAT
jgi:hypothetical protein